MREEKLRCLETSLRDVLQLLETDESFEPRHMNRLTALSWGVHRHSFGLGKSA